MSPAEFMRTYEAAANAHNLDMTLDLIADDAIYLFSDQSAHVGKDAIRKAIEANFDVIKNERYSIEGLIWLTDSKEVAACVYEFNWSGEIDGQVASGGGRGTTVLRRVAGNWRIAHEHLSRGRLK
jgi:ketosteroid isomerase-like protein